MPVLPDERRYRWEWKGDRGALASSSTEPAIAYVPILKKGVAPGVPLLYMYTYMLYFLYFIYIFVIFFVLFIDSLNIYSDFQIKVCPEIEKHAKNPCWGGPPGPPDPTGEIKHMIVLVFVFLCIF